MELEDNRIPFKDLLNIHPFLKKVDLEEIFIKDDSSGKYQLKNKKTKAVKAYSLDDYFSPSKSFYIFKADNKGMYWLRPTTQHFGSSSTQKLEIQYTPYMDWHNELFLNKKTNCHQKKEF